MRKEVTRYLESD